MGWGPDLWGPYPGTGMAVAGHRYTYDVAQAGETVQVQAGKGILSPWAEGMGKGHRRDGWGPLRPTCTLRTLMVTLDVHV